MAKSKRCSRTPDKFAGKVFHLVDVVQVNGHPMEIRAARPFAEIVVDVLRYVENYFLHNPEPKQTSEVKDEE